MYCIKLEKQSLDSSITLETVSKYPVCNHEKCFNHMVSNLEVSHFNICVKVNIYTDSQENFTVVDRKIIKMKLGYTENFTATVFRFLHYCSMI